MTGSVTIMYGVGTLLMLAGALVLMSLFRVALDDPRRVAFRIAGVMLAAAGCLLIAYAGALHSWRAAPAPSKIPSE